MLERSAGSKGRLMLCGGTDQMEKMLQTITTRFPTVRSRSYKYTKKEN